ncbi:hypothetical protein BV511_14855 [Methylorubrum extorquens]|uniref:hypothetical protein n=1 Tax=Methylorubrum extorquens TaxID=408 RepID=UPI000700CF7F|nr:MULTISPECIES: hypothetical protein [Methylorubrum]APX85876.1 hypothetical protein BV511_14855 [Methylorubrum extorquens]ARO57207.1 hypothetical protein B2G69_25635 [Methylorubrum zatmanii]KQQ04574.1 hypothetical protein ASF59_02110 [Methylobacterium sp. Leaf121]
MQIAVKHSLQLYDPDDTMQAEAAGWSHARGRGEIYKLDTSAAEWRVELQGDGFIMPGENPAQVERLQAHGWDLSDERQDERRLLELIHHQCAIDDLL